uniref:Uncharacterized protein n=1 Tax=Fagus sylvatica TaxID=28930 RepID=A0A2N9ILY0_FAGSY
MAVEILRTNNRDREESVCAHLASRFPSPSPPHSLTLAVAAHLASHLLASVVTASSRVRPSEGQSGRERYD